MEPSVEDPTHKLRSGPSLGRLAGVVIGLGTGLAVLAGCESSYTAVGKSQVWAEYSFGVLAADLPQGVRVPAVVAAADASLRHRGYSVSSNGTTSEQGEVQAKAPASSGLDSVDVSARAIEAGTRVKVKVGMIGDEALSRAVLEDVVRRLGL